MRFAIVSEELTRDRLWSMVPGMVTYYFRGKLLPWNKNNKLPGDDCSYDTRAKAERALKRAIKNNIFALYSGYENLANTFKVVEVE